MKSLYSLMFLKCRISYVKSKITSTQFTFEYNLKIYLHNKNLILAFQRKKKTVFRKNAQISFLLKVFPTSFSFNNLLGKKFASSDHKSKIEYRNLCKTILILILILFKSYTTLEWVRLSKCK